MDERIFALLTWHIYYCVDLKDTTYNESSDNAAIMLLLARMAGKKDTALSVVVGPRYVVV